jgi:hypothetical protein
MKQSVNFSDFCDAFESHGRNDTFTYAGKRALFDYLEEYEYECGEEIELDVIALCCEYSEHESALVCVEDNGYDVVSDLLTCASVLGSIDADIRAAIVEKAALAYLQDNTSVIVFDGGVIIQGF